MPYAMFFNWERQGVQTGLAIHAASGERHRQAGPARQRRLRASVAGNAATLFNLIRADYRGPVPRFAYDCRQPHR